MSNSMTDVFRNSFDEMAIITGEVFERIENDADAAIYQKEKENQSRDGQEPRADAYRMM
jgi:hypothetical protein